MGAYLEVEEHKASTEYVRVNANQMRMVRMNNQLPSIAVESHIVGLGVVIRQCANCQ